MADYRKYLAFGSGVGIEVRGEDLEAAVVRVRPSGVELMGRTVIRQFRDRPAAEWGAEYAEFLKQAGGAHLSATVLLPRGDVIVRHLLLPGVAAGDMDSAVAYQIDSLHPYSEEEAVSGWCPLGPGAVLVGIVRRPVLERYVELFAEAGVPVASLTFSAAAVHGALRLFGAPPAGGFLAASATPAGGIEIYGESPARPVFSAEFDLPLERAAVLGASELRLPPDTQAAPLEQVLPTARMRAGGEGAGVFAYVAALAGACPRLARAANLLPAPLRHANSRAMFVPTAILAALLLVTGVGALAYGAVADRIYLRKLQAEIARLEPAGREAASLDRQIENARARIKLLGEFDARTRHDLDALNELTRLLPPPIWTTGVDLMRDTANINGEAEQAVGLIKVIDGSNCFHNSEPTVLARTGPNELFRIRTTRREGCR
jgi:hypothetical protein